MINRNRIAGALAASLLVLSTHTLGADVRADQKTRVEFAGMLGRMVNLFGGKAAREGVTSTVAVKGDRKATTTGRPGRSSISTEEKIYDARPEEEVLQGHDVRRAAAADGRGAEEGGGRGARRPAREARPEAPGRPIRTRKKWRSTSTSRTPARRRPSTASTPARSIMTITLREKGKTLEQSGGLVMTSDMWLAPKIAAMKEIADFDLRYAQKLDGPMCAAPPPNRWRRRWRCIR